MTGQADDRPLEATGERLVPELQHGQVVHAEHLVRYRVAAQLAPSRRVLDVACGEGYGTALLTAAGARSATGVDLDEHAVTHARTRHPGVEFTVGDVRELPFGDGTFDLVVCFETIEHVADPECVVAELRRVMAEDGLLLASTPNKRQYLVENEFHEREFLHEEFLELLQARFARVEVLLQHNWLTSAVLAPRHAREASGDEPLEVELRKVAGIEPGGELYTVALCGRGQLPELRPAAVAASVDEAHELARRAGAAERTAEMWHDEYKKAERVYQQAERALFDVYDSVWWRMTARPRRLLELVRRRIG
jgi:O-antigen biosynthesis protein